MRPLRPLSALLASALLVSVLTSGEPLARAQSTGDAQDAAQRAQQRAEAATGLVDEAVANRDQIERMLADSITRMNELATELSIVGSNLDRVASQVGYADVELAGIQADIETQAVDAYMTVVSSPSVSLVNTSTVEKALVATSVVEDVVADGKATVGELTAKRKDLVALQEAFLADQERYRALQEEMDAEVAKYTALFEEADAEVAGAIREAQSAEQAYRAALTAVQVAEAKEEERRRQEQRGDVTTTTSPPATSQPSNPTTTTSPPAPTTTEGGGGGGGPWNHPPAVEQWRGLVSSFFPSSRVEEALRIIDCESNGDPDALNPYSGAAGLFQFLPSTWASASAGAGYGDSSVLDPEANIASAAWLAGNYENQGLYYWQAWSCRRVLG
jgi:hypothetical protein